MAKAKSIITTLTSRQIRRFWSYVPFGDIDKCWEWSGDRSVDGYGRFWVAYRIQRAHRLSYYLTTGVDPGQLLVLHDCDNRACCNPEHLYLGTDADNSDDKMSRGRCKPRSGEDNHIAKLTESDVLAIRQLHSMGGSRLKDIGEQYGVHAVTIFDIIHRRTWAHVGGICTTSPNGGEAPSLPITAQSTGTSGATP